ncbi:hypothetical protein EDD86DRAFT_210036 [Gorgonomyces haynaldii]|nr:hypothetical protein EDD86DRAFT_210036 [Gorgonomyces haynaldii]
MSILFETTLDRSLEKHPSRFIAMGQFLANWQQQENLDNLLGFLIEDSTLDVDALVQEIVKTLKPVEGDFSRHVQLIAERVPCLGKQVTYQVKDIQSTVYRVWEVDLLYLPPDQHEQISQKRQERIQLVEKWTLKFESMTPEEQALVRKGTLCLSGSSDKKRKHESENVAPNKLKKTRSVQQNKEKIEKERQEKLKRQEEERKQKMERIEREKQAKLQKQEQERLEKLRIKQEKEQERLKKQQQKEQERLLKIQEKEAKQQERLKKQQEKDLEKSKKEEEKRKREEKEQLEAKRLKRLDGFFKTAKKSDPVQEELSWFQTFFKPFHVKSNCSMAWPSPQKTTDLESIDDQTCQEQWTSFLKQQRPVVKPRSLNPSEIQNATSEVQNLPWKLLHFSEDVRPSFYGPWSLHPKSSKINGRRPFGKDEQMDYEVDSELEWEEDEPGEELGSEDEIEEEEEEDEEEEDGWLVPHGYLSEDEGIEEDPKPAPEQQKETADQKAGKEDDKKKEPKRKVVEPLNPVVFGPFEKTLQAYKIQLFAPFRLPIDCNMCTLVKKPSQRTPKASFPPQLILELANFIQSHEKGGLTKMIEAFKELHPDLKKTAIEAQIRSMTTYGKTPGSKMQWRLKVDFSTPSKKSLESAKKMMYEPRSELSDVHFEDSGPKNLLSDMQSSQPTMSQQPVSQQTIQERVAEERLSQQTVQAVYSESDVVAAADDDPNDIVLDATPVDVAVEDVAMQDVEMADHADAVLEASEPAVVSVAVEDAEMAVEQTADTAEMTVEAPVEVTVEATEKDPQTDLDQVMEKDPQTETERTDVQTLVITKEDETTYFKTIGMALEVMQDTPQAGLEHLDRFSKPEQLQSQECQALLYMAHLTTLDLEVRAKALRIVGDFVSKTEKLLRDSPKKPDPEQMQVFWRQLFAGPLFYTVLGQLDTVSLVQRQLLRLLINLVAATTMTTPVCIEGMFSQNRASGLHEPEMDAQAL